MIKFKLGDVVRLKSGGPTMTVTSIDRDGDVGVIWFLNGEIRSASILANCLDLIVV